MRALLLLMAIFLALMIGSCTRTIYQERDVIHYDTTYVSKFTLDTVIQRDSIHVLERGDTITTTIYKYIYKVREHTDTIYKEKVDTIRSVDTKIETKTVRKNNWLELLGCIMSAFIVGLLIASFRKV